jgi:hypothetical protein
MPRVLLRLLLILALVMNGVGAPWTMAHPHSPHADAAAPHSAMHDSSATGHAHHGTLAGHGQPDDAAADLPSSCCDGPECGCGCLLPPLLARAAPDLVAFAWGTAPGTEPATRFAGRHGAPPYRPPAA